MKRLKPGQLATINGHVYRCSKAVESPCMKCTFYDQCICGNDPFNNPFGIPVCVKIFGGFHYPILVK